MNTPTQFLSNHLYNEEIELHILIGMLKWIKRYMFVHYDTTTFPAKTSNVFILYLY